MALDGVLGEVLRGVLRGGVWDAAGDAAAGVHEASDAGRGEALDEALHGEA